MTEGQILLEALSKPDWSKKLQEKGIEVNEPTLELISQKLKGMNSPKPLDYNPAVSNFNETLDKSTIKDVAALRVEPAGLKGGIFYEYDKHSQQYYGRIMTLTDPEGRAHVFNKGECDDYIAHSTAKWIEFYRNQYVA